MQPLTMTLLNVIWPAIYVASGLIKLWYCIVGTIMLEWVILKLYLKTSWKRSFFMSAVGNAVSGLAGIYLMPWVMIGWHIIADRFLPNATFDILNWYLTYILMCLGSVLIEVCLVRTVFKTPIKLLFFPMLTGNALTYILLGILVLRGVVRVS
jgi:hypothetical protein